MKSLAAFLVCTAALTIALPASAALPVGARAPVITTKAALGGKPFDFVMARALKKGPVVIYFFPAAFTQGCTIETHEFAEAAAEFEQNGATLIGLSADPIDKLAKFSVEACRNKFPVGVATPATITGYDVPLKAGATMTNRTSYVIAPNGTVLYTLSQMNPAGHVQGTLDAVKAWKASKKR
ncbi:peroxiredoxin [Sphingomonas sp.]|uniref:peroxiredoxin n=1 Tax=Sphingomonas sp. TaxID=28214 RepID=UPI003D6D0713